MSVNPEIPDDTQALRTFVYVDEPAYPQHLASEPIVKGGNPYTVSTRWLRGGTAEGGNVTIYQNRLGSAAQWVASNLVLMAAEPGFELDTGRFKIGDGVTPWVDLPYFLNEAALSDGYTSTAQLRDMEARVAQDFRAMPTVMSSPPTITVAAPSTTSTISGSVTVQPDAPDAVYFGGAVPMRGTTYPSTVLILSNFNHVTKSGIYAEPVWWMEFDYDGSVIEWVTRGYQANFRVLIDGQYAGPRLKNSIAYDGDLNLIKINFGSREIRRIRVEMDGIMPVGEFHIEATATMWAAPRVAPRVVFVGDSWTEPTFIDSSAATYTTHDGWATVASRLLGWEDRWVLGLGGTGYLAPGGEGRMKLRDRLHNDLCLRQPDIAVVAMGFNDAGFTNSEIAAEASLVFQEILDHTPGVRLFVLSPFYPEISSSTVIARAAAIEAVVPAGHHFINVVSPSLITGTGDQASPTGTGNADIYMGGDTQHLTYAGHQYIGRRVAALIRATFT